MNQLVTAMCILLILINPLLAMEILGEENEKSKTIIPGSNERRN